MKKTTRNTNAHKERRSWLNYEYLFLFLIILSAVGLRFYRIGSSDFWLDESNTVLISESNFSEMTERLKWDSSPPLFYFLLHYWMKIAGKSETGLRSFSALIGIILVIIMFFTGRKFFSMETGLLSALFAAVFPIQVMYSQELRMYTLLPLTAVLSFYFLLRFLSDDRNSFLIGYIISLTAWHPANQDKAVLLRNPQKLETEASDLIEDIRKGLTAQSRLFILFVPDKVNEFLYRQVMETFGESRIKTAAKFRQSLIWTPVLVLIIQNEGSVKGLS